MGESTDKRMGPRETRLREEATEPGSPPIDGDYEARRRLREARLADALEEALEGWSKDVISLREDGGQTTLSQEGTIARLRAVLAETVGVR